jgi:hypothetical protein
MTATLPGSRTVKKTGASVPQPLLAVNTDASSQATPPDDAAFFLHIFTCLKSLADSVLSTVERCVNQDEASFDFYPQISWMPGTRAIKARLRSAGQHQHHARAITKILSAGTGV